MTTLERSPMTMTGLVRTATALRVVLGKLTDLYRAWRNRREIYQLGRLSNSELADIGLTRADLHVAWRMPLGTDPTTHLGAIAEMRATNELRRAVDARLESAAREVN